MFLVQILYNEGEAFGGQSPYPPELVKHQHSYSHISVRGCCISHLRLRLILAPGIWREDGKTRDKQLELHSRERSKRKVSAGRVHRAIHCVSITTNTHAQGNGQGANYWSRDVYAYNLRHDCKPYFDLKKDKFKSLPTHLLCIQQ